MMKKKKGRYKSKEKDDT